jgi:hypothetical protein
MFIKITGCKDKRLWYADKIGKVFLVLGKDKVVHFDTNDITIEYLVKTVDGFNNIVRECDCFEVDEFVEDSDDIKHGNFMQNPRQPASPKLEKHQQDVKKMILSSDSTERKGVPITTGVLDYFPLAIAEVSKCSKAGNDQHHPGKPLHWDKTKSLDHADCVSRHLIDRGTFDTDGVRHSAKLAWRALALLQTELEKEKSEK